ITLDYRTVKPRSGVYFIDRVHYIWTQGETEANRFWVPTYDYPNDRTTWEMYITTPANEKALSNGRLAGSRKVPGGIEWHWVLDKPASTYLMSIATGPYVVLNDHWEDVPVDYWVYPDSVQAGWRGFGATPRAVGVFSRKTGVKYPWAKYDQSVAPDYIFGGMENVTATTQLDDGILHPQWAEPQANSDGLVAHELGHQWYGDLLTTKTWAHIWLNEGFATFMEQIFREEDKGKDEGAWDRMGAQDQVIGADRNARRPLVFDRWVNDPFELFFSGHIYPKGATVMQMLRHQLGDSLFWSAMHRYTIDHMYGNVTSEDLQHAFEQTTGRNFDRFFKEWVYGAGLPAFRVSYEWNADSRALTLHAEEVQPRDSLTGSFDVDVDVEVLTDAAPVRDVVKVRNGTGTLNMTLSGAPRSIRWDKGGWLLDVTDFPRPTVMLAYQLGHDDDVIGRAEAVSLLRRRVSQPEAVSALAGAAQTDRFWGVRQRAVSALQAVTSDATARAAVMAASQDADARVRQSAAAVLGGFGAPARARLTELATSDASYYVRGTAVTALARNAGAEAMPTIQTLLGQNSWQDLLRTAAITAIGFLSTPEAYTTLLGYITPASSQNARVTAINILPRKAQGKEAELAKTLEPLLSDNDFQVRIAVAQALGQLAQASSVPVLEARAKIEAESRVLGVIQQALARIKGK
ncbi:MAG TPA: M1 family aminopeptidase, partial [Longimicrobiales bacterium]